MVIEYTVEGAVHSIIDIVHQSPIIGHIVFFVRAWLVVHDDLFGNDVDNQCVSRCHIKAPWLRNNLNTSVSRKILVQGRVDYCCDLQVKNRKSSQAQTLLMLQLNV